MTKYCHLKMKLRYGLQSYIKNAFFDTTSSIKQRRHGLKLSSVTPKRGPLPEVSMDLSVVPLHNYPQYMEKCCKLINKEWKRSDTARLRSLESSGDNLPTCLILLKDKELIGHLKLSFIPSMRDSCFVESVVIDKELRGKGYGSYLMNEAENYCKKVLELKSVHLSTKGQEDFYRKLGYRECGPVSIYGTYAPPTEIKTNASKVDCGNGNCPPPPPLPKNAPLNRSKTYMIKFL